MIWGLFQNGPNKVFFLVFVIWEVQLMFLCFFLFRNSALVSFGLGIDGSIWFCTREEFFVLVVLNMYMNNWDERIERRGKRGLE